MIKSLTPTFTPLATSTNRNSIERTSVRLQNVKVITLFIKAHKHKFIYTHILAFGQSRGSGEIDNLSSNHTILRKAVHLSHCYCLSSLESMRSKKIPLRNVADR